MEKFTKILFESLESAGKILIKYFGNLERIDYKGECNPVTQADIESESEIVKIIKGNFPNHCFLAEEKEKSGTLESEYLWIIDPLDGTVNYSHSMPIFAVSIALMIKGRIELGGVYNPISKELFFAQRGLGAFLNNKKIYVSNVNELDKSMMVTGFPYDRRVLAEHYCGIFKEFLIKSQCLRRLGAASLDLCFVACGRVDGFYEEKLNPWDTAAGWLIVEEAGGKVSDFSGKEYSVFTPHIAVSNGMIHNEIVNILRRYI